MYNSRVPWRVLKRIHAGPDVCWVSSHLVHLPVLVLCTVSGGSLLEIIAPAYCSSPSDDITNNHDMCQHPISRFLLSCVLFLIPLPTVFGGANRRRVTVSTRAPLVVDYGRRQPPSPR